MVQARRDSRPSTPACAPWDLLTVPALPQWRVLATQRPATMLCKVCVRPIYIYGLVRMVMEFFYGHARTWSAKCQDVECRCQGSWACRRIIWRLCYLTRLAVWPACICTAGHSSGRSVVLALNGSTCAVQRHMAATMRCSVEHARPDLSPRLTQLSRSATFKARSPQ